MDEKHHDQIFIVTFLGVLGFLGTLTILIGIIANYLDAPKPDPTATARLEERIRPAGSVITDPEALMKVTAARTVSRAPMTGAEIVTKVCAACHQAGVLNAPKIGDAGVWNGLMSAKGLDGLVQSVNKGLNAMPPKGGDPSLSDDEVRAAVTELLKASGV